MAKLIHTMIRVQDLQRSLQFYQQAFHFSVAHRLDFPEFTLVYLRNGEADAEIELTWNEGRAEPYTHGDGYGHVAVCVDDAKAERQRLVELGFAPNAHDGEIGAEGGMQEAPVFEKVHNGDVVAAADRTDLIGCASPVGHTVVNVVGRGKRQRHRQSARCRRELRKSGSTHLI
jgi:lactoylglutathione lyase